MIANEEFYKGNTYDLTNSVYSELIEQLLRHYVDKFESLLVPRSESELLAGANSDILMQLGIGESQLAEPGFASTSAKFLRIESVLAKLFRLYNKEREEAVAGTTELEWLMARM